VLEKILEAAGIGLTLGTGALAGLGIEASLAARVLLWADRAAFVLGTLTSVLREHRSWLVETFGSGFMDAVDIVHSACAIYGIARVALEAPRIILGLRNTYRAFREASRARSSGLSSTEQATVQSVTQSTDELLQQVDEIQGARTGAPQGGQPRAGEPATGGGTPEPTVQPQARPQPHPPEWTPRPMCLQAQCAELRRLMRHTRCMPARGNGPRRQHTWGRGRVDARQRVRGHECHHWHV
jgi:hypothetical protein